MRVVLHALTLLIVLLAPASGWTTIDVDEILRALARRSVGLADDVPMPRPGAFDDLARAKLARRWADEGLAARRSLVRSADQIVAGMARGARSADDAALRASVAALDDGSRQIAAAVADGGRVVSDAVGDITTRGRLLSRGGVDMLAAVGVHGDGIVDDVLRLDSAIEAGTVAAGPGGRALTLAQFGHTMVEHGAAAGRFFSTYVRPHWRLWLTSGALAAWVVDPDGFMDTTGAITQAGTEAVARIGGAALEGAVKGASEGAKGAVLRATDNLGRTFTGTDAWAAWVGAVLLMLIGGLSLRRPRRWLLMPLRWLNTTKQS